MNVGRGKGPFAPTGGAKCLIHAEVQQRHLFSPVSPQESGASCRFGEDLGELFNQP